MDNERRLRWLKVALLFHGRVRVITDAGTLTLDFSDSEKREIVRLQDGRIEIKPHASWDWFKVVDHLEVAWVGDVM